MLVIEHLHKSFSTAQGPLPVLQGVDLHLAQGSSLLMVTHSPRQAARLEQRCVLHAGRIQREAL